MKKIIFILFLLIFAPIAFAVDDLQTLAAKYLANGDDSSTSLKLIVEQAEKGSAEAIAVLKDPKILAVINQRSQPEVEFIAWAEKRALLFLVGHGEPKAINSTALTHWFRSNQRDIIFDVFFLAQKGNPHALGVIQRFAREKNPSVLLDLQQSLSSDFLQVSKLIDVANEVGVTKNSVPLDYDGLASKIINSADGKSISILIDAANQGNDEAIAVLRRQEIGAAIKSTINFSDKLIINNKKLIALVLYQSDADSLQLLTKLAREGKFSSIEGLEKVASKGNPEARIVLQELAASGNQDAKEALSRLSTPTTSASELDDAVKRVAEFESDVDSIPKVDASAVDDLARETDELQHLLPFGDIGEVTVESPVTPPSSGIEPLLPEAAEANTRRVARETVEHADELTARRIQPIVDDLTGVHDDAAKVLLLEYAPRAEQLLYDLQLLRRDFDVDSPEIKRIDDLLERLFRQERTIHNLANIHREVSELQEEALRSYLAARSSAAKLAAVADAVEDVAGSGTPPQTPGGTATPPEIASDLRQTAATVEKEAGDVIAAVAEGVTDSPAANATATQAATNADALADTVARETAERTVDTMHAATTAGKSITVNVSGSNNQIIIDSKTGDVTLGKKGSSPSGANIADDLADAGADAVTGGADDLAREAVVIPPSEESARAIGEALENFDPSNTNVSADDLRNAGVTDDVMRNTGLSDNFINGAAASADDAAKLSRLARVAGAVKSFSTGLAITEFLTLFSDGLAYYAHNSTRPLESSYKSPQIFWLDLQRDQIGYADRYDQFVYFNANNNPLENKLFEPAPQDYSSDPESENFWSRESAIIKGYERNSVLYIRGNGSKNMFALRDHLIKQSVAYPNWTNFLNGFELIVARNTRENNLQIINQKGYETIEQIYVVVFDEEGKEYPISGGGTEVINGVFNNAILCDKPQIDSRSAEEISQFTCNLSLIESSNLEDGKYIVGIFIKFKDEVFSSSVPTVLLGADNQLRATKCSFSRENANPEKPDMDFCPFFKDKIIPQNQLVFAVDTALINHRNKNTYLGAVADAFDSTGQILTSSPPEWMDNLVGKTVWGIGKVVLGALDATASAFDTAAKANAIRRSRNEMEEFAELLKDNDNPYGARAALFGYPMFFEYQVGEPTLVAGNNELYLTFSEEGLRLLKTNNIIKRENQEQDFVSMAKQLKVTDPTGKKLKVEPVTLSDADRSTLGISAVLAIRLLPIEGETLKSGSYSFVYTFTSLDGKAFKPLNKVYNVTIEGS